VHVAVALYTSLFERDIPLRDATIGRNVTPGAGRRQTAVRRANQAYAAPTLQSPNRHRKTELPLDRFVDMHQLRLVRLHLAQPRAQQSWDWCHIGQGGNPGRLGLSDREREQLAAVSLRPLPPLGQRRRGRVVALDSLDQGEFDMLGNSEAAAATGCNDSEGDDTASTETDAAAATTDTAGPERPSAAAQRPLEHHDSASDSSSHATEVWLSTAQTTTRSGRQSRRRGAADGGLPPSLSALAAQLPGGAVPQAARQLATKHSRPPRPPPKASPAAAAAAAPLGTGRLVTQPVAVPAARRSTSSRSRPPRRAEPRPERSVDDSEDEHLRLALEASRQDFGRIEQRLHAMEEDMALLPRFGLRTHEKRAIGDGACLFRSVAILLYGSDARHGQLRADAVQYASAHFHRFGALVSPFEGNGVPAEGTLDDRLRLAALNLAPADVPATLWPIYLDGMVRHDSFADHIMVTCLGEVLGVNLLIITVGNGLGLRVALLQCSTVTEDFAVTCCLLCQSDTHYEPLVWNDSVAESGEAFVRAELLPRLLHSFQSQGFRVDSFKYDPHDDM